jgi:hypothetical protein
MNFKSWKHPILAPVILAVALMGCSGPWNTEVDSKPAPVQLQVSCMLVAGRSFDSLWLERPLSFYRKYDSSTSFIDTVSSDVFIVREDSVLDTVFYRMSGSNTRVWLPVNNLDTVRLGAQYHLRASLRWNAAREFPIDTDWRTDTLDAVSRVQSSYNVDHTVLAPIEALHPSLSMGLPGETMRMVLADTAALLGRLYDSLNAIRSLAGKGITPVELFKYLQGTEVLLPLRDGDSAYYIFDASDVPDPDGGDMGMIKRYTRQWKFRQNVAASEYGGVVIAGEFDNSRARIWSPLDKLLSVGFGDSEPDVEKFYQPGQSRLISITEKTPENRPGYPAILPLGNASLGYTGKNTLRFYAVDADYAKDREQEADPASGDMSGGLGDDDNGDLPSHSNIRGGIGYFATAVQDSFTIYIQAVSPDTFPVPDMRRSRLKD